MYTDNNIRIVNITSQIGESEYNIMRLNLLDEQYTKTSFYGVEKMTAYLKEMDHTVNVKRVRRLLRSKGL